MTATAIRLTDVTVAYERRPVLRQVSVSFATASLTAVIGPNGAGKTTFLKAIIGLLPIGAGEIELVAARRDQIAYLPQRSEIDRSFPISVQDVVGLGHWRRTGALGRIGRAGMQAVWRALEEVGLAGCAGQPIETLSAGQFQRALFARLLVQNCPIVVLDEPFAAVDARTTADLLELVRSWQGQGRTVIVALHDLSQVRSQFPETLLLAREVVAWGPTERVLQPENLLRAWGMPDALVEAPAPRPMRMSA